MEEDQPASADGLAVDELFRVSPRGEPHVLQHYLYSSSREASGEAAAELRRSGFATEERLGADGVNWLVLALRELVR